MEQSMLTIEAFAHYMRGAITLFFVFWCFKLYMYKRRNRMMKLLFYSTLFIAFGHIKDAVFIFSEWKYSLCCSMMWCVPSTYSSSRSYVHSSLRLLARDSSLVANYYWPWECKRCFRRFLPSIPI